MPTAHALRAPTEADADAVAALLRAREQRDLGAPETTADDVLSEWRFPGVELERDAWLVEEPDGRLAAYALVTGTDLLVAVHPEATGRGLGGGLRHTAERRARERGVRVARQFVAASDEAARAQLLADGWWPAQHYFRMRIDLRDAPPPPRLLVRPFDAERDAEELWHLVEGAYADVEGHLPRSLEGWLASALESEPALWLLLHDAQGIAGAALGERAERRTGLIATLAVAERARGQGNGRGLVLKLLEAFRGVGLRYAETAVHGKTAAAARVFEAAGMHVARRTERWEKTLGG